MQQQPLAFTLVKTVVLARDEGRTLGPALATAWAMLFEELSAAHRMLFAELRWAPEHQDDLKLVIDGVRAYFQRDPDLEQEILAFLAEVEAYDEGEPEHLGALPVVLAGGALPSLSVEPAPATRTVEPEHSPEPQPEAQPEPQARPASAPEPQPEPAPTPTATLNEVLPAPPAPATRYWPYALGAAVLLLFLGAIAYFVTRPVVPSAPQEPVYPNTDTLASAPGEYVADEHLATSLLVASVSDRHVDSLRAAGNYSQAYAQQLVRVDALDTDGASPRERALALAELATLASANRRPLAALEAQRASLLLLYEASATELLRGRAHLRMAHFYLLNDEPIMATAHQRQARQCFGQSSEPPSDRDLGLQRQVTEQLRLAS